MSGGDKVFNLCRSDYPILTTQKC